MTPAYPVTEVLRILRGGLDDHEPDVVPPIHVSVPYRFLGSKVSPVEEVKYGRENNPTTMLLEKAMAAAEGAKWCLAFNTGMAAIAATLETIRHAGAKRIISSRLLYGTTRSLLDFFATRGLEVSYAGPPWSELLDAINSWKPHVVFIETIGNPTLRVPPIEEVSKECRLIDCTLVVDNTFASPYLYRPCVGNQHVLVVESLTKYIGGHNDVMGGILCGNDTEIMEKAWTVRKTYGTIMQPFDAFLAARGLKTLHLRVEYSSKAAMEIASALQNVERIQRVYYPGLETHPDHNNAKHILPGLYGGVLSFDVGDSMRAKELLRYLRIVVPSPSLGGVESIIAYPYESSHRGLSNEEKKQLGITSGLLRLSVGLEKPKDILEDILSALEQLPRQ